MGTMTRKQFNTAVADLAREAGFKNPGGDPILWAALTADRTISPKKALKRVMAAGLTPEEPAKLVKAAKPAKKAPKARKVSDEPRNERVTVVNGQARVIVREAGRIVENRPATKAQAKASGLNVGKGGALVVPVEQPKAAPKASEVSKSGKRFLSKKSRLDYIAAALEQDEEYLDAVREFHGLDEKALPSVRQCAFYALAPHVSLKVPGFKIGKGYKAMFAEKA